MQFLNVLAIIFSLLLAVFLLYLLLAMALPQIYLSIVGLVNAFPEYINSVQEWLQKFLADNPDIQNTVMSVYVSAADSLEDWLNADILPNLESVTTTVQWLRQSVLPNLTGVMSSVSALVVSLALLVKDLLIALIVTFYLLIRKDVFAAQSKKIVYAQFAMNLVALGIEERETDVRNLKTENHRIAPFLWNQGNSQSVITEIFLAAYESVIRLLSLLHLHLAVVPPDIEGDGLVVLSGYMDEIIDVLPQVNHLGRLNLLIIIAQRAHPHLAWNRIIFPFGISRGCSRLENEENHSFFLPRAIFAAREALRLLGDEEWG